MSKFLRHIRPLPVKFQLDAMDCGAACISMIASFYRKDIPMAELRELTHGNREGSSLLGIADAAEKKGLRTKGVRISLEKLEEAPLPCILHWQQNHFIVLYKIRKKGSSRAYVIADPIKGKLTIDQDTFQKGWVSTAEGNTDRGIALLLEPTPTFYEQQTGSIAKKKGVGYALKYLRPYQKYIIQLFIGLIVGSLLQLIFPFLTQSIVDYGINLRDLNFIYLILLGQLFFVFSRIVVEYIRRWILLHISTRVNISIISDFLVKLMGLPIGYFDSKKTGDLLQRINDHERIESFLTSSTLSILFSAFNIIIFGAVLWYYNVQIFFVFLIGSTCYVGWVSAFLHRRRELDYKRFMYLSQNQSNLLQLITGIQEIKLNNCERQKRWEWEHIQANLFKVSTKSMELEQMQTIGSSLINEVKNILIAILAAKLVIQGHITVGIMLAVQYINGQLNGPITSLIDFAISYQNAKISIERLQEIHLKPEEEKSGIVQNELPEERTIRIQNLSFRYNDPHAKKALDNLNLEIPEGETTAIVGVSGSGKTTLVKLLLGFYQPEEGLITVGGANLQEIDDRLWRDSCGAVMQDGFIFSDSIARNIALGDEVIDKKKLIYAAKISNLLSFVLSLPLKFNTVIGTEGVGISQGQKQRILIARAVYKSPQFIFFDEATNALDAKNERSIVEHLHEFFRNRTVVVVAHRLSTVRNADQIIVLDQGRIVEKGKHSELVARRGKYYSLVKDQLELEMYGE